MRLARGGRVAPTVVGGLVLAILFAGLHAYRPTALVLLDLKLYDLLLPGASPQPGRGEVAIVDLDEESLAAFGQWPWPRGLVARLLEETTRLGARSVGVDVLFPEPGRDSPPAAAVPVDWIGGGDRDLGEVLGRGPYVLGCTFRFDAAATALPRDALPPPLRVALLQEPGAQGGAAPLFRATGLVSSWAGIARASPAVGFLNATPDRDGVLRRIPLVVSYGDRLYPSLALATWLRATGEAQVLLRVGRRGVESLRVGETTIPLDPRGNLLIPFRRDGPPFPRVSARAVLMGTAPEGALRGRFVLVGASAAGLERGIPTPVSPVTPGVDVHATVVAGLLSGNFFCRPTWATAVELLTVLVAGTAAALLLAWAPSAWGAFALGLGALGLWQGAAWAFRVEGLFLSPGMPILTLAGEAAALSVLRSLGAEKGLRRRGEALARAQGLLLESLTSLAENRSQAGPEHGLRVQRYARTLCASWSLQPGCRGLLDAAAAEMIARLAPIRDIGKVRVPDGILLKTGRLSEAELAMLRKHPQYGRETLEQAAPPAVARSEVLLTVATDIVYGHHERWDGAGYPEGLEGDAIPLAARLVALVDVYDALTSPRAYRPPFSHADAVRVIAEGRGTQFDPRVVDAFLEVAEQWPGETPGGEEDYG